MAERSKAADSKSVVPFCGTVGSNPTLSASRVWPGASLAILEIVSQLDRDETFQKVGSFLPRGGGPGDGFWDSFKTPTRAAKSETPVPGEYQNRRGGRAVEGARLESV